MKKNVYAFSMHEFCYASRARTSPVNQLWWSYSCNFIYNWLQILERDWKNVRQRIRSHQLVQLSYVDGECDRDTVRGHMLVCARTWKPIHTLYYEGSHAALIKPLNARAEDKLQRHSTHGQRCVLARDSGNVRVVFVVVIFSGGKQQHKYKCPKSVFFLSFLSTGKRERARKHTSTRFSKFGASVLLCSWRTSSHSSLPPAIWRPRSIASTCWIHEKKKQNVHKNGNILAVGHLALPGNDF